MNAVARHVKMKEHVLTESIHTAAAVDLVSMELTVKVKNQSKQIM